MFDPMSVTLNSLLSILTIQVCLCYLLFFFSSSSFVILWLKKQKLFYLEIKVIL